jgi:hypothetical protein
MLQPGRQHISCLAGGGGAGAGDDDADEDATDAAVAALVVVDVVVDDGLRVRPAARLSGGRMGLRLPS